MCSDGTNKEQCASNGCSWSQVEDTNSECQGIICSSNDQCNDGKDCSQDTCTAGKCSYSIIDTIACKSLPPPIVEPSDPCSLLRNEVFGVSLTPSIFDWNYQDCKLKNSKQFIYFTVGIGIIGAILIYFTTRKFFGNDTETKILNALLSLVAGSLISLFFYNFAVYAIIFVIVLLIIMMIINAVF